MRKLIPASVIGPTHPDFSAINYIEGKILECSSGIGALRRFFGAMLREEIDRLIDTPNTDRRNYAELEKVEKTYIGTRVEIRLRKFWGFPKGRLDLKIGHMDADIKHTMESGWMIPSEAVGQPCILSAADETTALCYLGVVIAKSEYLTSAGNRDGKVSIAKHAWCNIRWLLLGDHYPPNFWKTLELPVVGHIFEGKSGAERLSRLFRAAPRRVIPRSALADAAQQLDPMKRIRGNGGARDALAPEGIAILIGNYDRDIIALLNLPACGPGEAIAVKIETDQQKELAAKYDLLNPRRKR